MLRLSEYYNRLNRVGYRAQVGGNDKIADPTVGKEWSRQITVFGPLRCGVETHLAVTKGPNGPRIKQRQPIGLDGI